MKKVALLLILAPAVLSAAGAQNAQIEPAAGMSMMMNCPIRVQGTSVAVSDTPAGIAVSLTTDPENVAELRRRVGQMAAMHGTGGPRETMKQGSMMPGTALYQEVDNGARLILTPNDPAKLAEFRKQVRTHVAMMQKGDCAMMQEMMQQMMQGIAGATAATPKSVPANGETDHSAHHPEPKP